MNHVKINSFKIKWLQILLLFLMVISPLAYAADQPNTLQFNSDSASCQQTNDDMQCIYLGHVVLVQGNSILQAPKVTVYKKYDKIYKIEATGEHTHYQTVSEDHKKIDAVANTITLYPDKNLMVLSGNGTIKEDQNSFAGPYLEYVFKK